MLKMNLTQQPDRPFWRRPLIIAAMVGGVVVIILIAYGWHLRVKEQQEHRANEEVERETADRPTAAQIVAQNEEAGIDAVAELRRLTGRPAHHAAISYLYDPSTELCFAYGRNSLAHVPCTEAVLVRAQRE